jgi:hypothetical protein
MRGTVSSAVRARSVTISVKEARTTMGHDVPRGRLFRLLRAIGEACAYAGLSYCMIPPSVMWEESGLWDEYGASRSAAAKPGGVPTPLSARELRLWAEIEGRNR